MTWQEYIAYFSDIDEGKSLGITLQFDNSEIVEPSFFTRLNYFFLTQIRDISSSNKIALIVPKHSKFIASLVLYKKFLEISNKTIETESILGKVEVGQKLGFYDAVVEVGKIYRKEDNTISRIIFTNGAGWETNKLPPLSIKPNNSKLTGPKAYREASQKWMSDSKVCNSILGSIKMSRTHRKKTTLIVGPTKRYRRLFETTKANGVSVTDYLSIAYIDGNLDIRPIEGAAPRYDIILCPDSCTALKTIKECGDETVDSVFFDISDSDCSEDYFQWAGRIEKCKDIEIVFCVKENFTFDLGYFIHENYSIFQWKRNYITQDFIFDEKNPNTLLLATFKERTFLVEVFNGSPVKEQLEIINSYNDSIIDETPDLIEAHHQFASEIIGLCKNYCFESQDYMLSRKTVLEARLDRLTNPSARKETRNHQLTSDLVKMKNVILDLYSKKNPKIDYVLNYLIEHDDEKICLIVPDNKNFDSEIIFSYYKSLVPYDIENSFDVLSVTAYKESASDYHTSILVGWNNKNAMKEALFSNNAFKNIILLYDFELPWFNYSASAWNRESHKNDFSQLGGIDTPDDEEFFSYEIDLETKDSVERNEELSLDEIKKKLNNNLAQSKKTSTTYNSGDECVEAAMVCFSDDTYGIFEKYKSFVCMNEVLKGNENKPLEKTTEDLIPGDIVLFKGKALNAINDLASNILKAKGLRRCEDIAKSWHDFINMTMLFEGIDRSEMIKRIKAQGCRRHDATIKSWVTSEFIICPNEKEDLECIAKACGEYGLELLGSLDECFAAAQEVKKAHIKAGFELSSMILDTDIIKQKITEKYDKCGYFDFSSVDFNAEGLGQISIVKVTDIGDFQDFPKTICGFREEN